jgi:uncharacterized RDD family membrane protein YckC
MNSASEAPSATIEYVGFWARTMASVVDTLIILVVSVPLLLLIYGMNYFTDPQAVAGTWDVVISYLFPIVAVLWFWIVKQATPGKMLLDAKIVDAKTGAKPSFAQFVLRYIGYILASIPLMLGIIWVGIDARKQGWHDKIAGTVVIRIRP